MINTKDVRQTTMRFKKYYSGVNSKSFWNKINAIKDKSKRNEAYSLGVVLQNVEADVLRLLELLK